MANSNPTTRQNLSSPKHVPTEKHLTSTPWIVHHILECKSTKELPLRIMFSFNAGHRLPTLRQAKMWWGGREAQGQVIIQFLSSLEKYAISPEDSRVPTPFSLQPDTGGKLEDDHCPYDRFMDPGNDRLIGIELFVHPDPPAVLPADFTKPYILNNVFRADYAEVEWIHALTALDYLRGYESMRRAKLRQAAENLGITTDNWRDVLTNVPDAKNWVQQVQEQELRIESFYANVFIDLRIWTMIHTLKSEYFYKSDVLAMLNTLFPPSVRELPNDRINPQILHKHRATFYRYIMAVEADGPKVMDSFEKRLLGPGTRHSWQETRENLEAYLELTDLMMDQASEVWSAKTFRGSQSSKTGSWTPSSASERPMTGSSQNTSFDGQQPMESPRLSGPAHDNASIKSRTRGLGQINTSNNASNPLDRSETSPPTPDSNGNPGSHITQNPTPKAPFDLKTKQSRRPTLSRPVTPFMEPNSEAALSETFRRPVTPLANPRKALHRHKRTISSIRLATSFDIGGLSPGTVDIANELSENLDWPLISPSTVLPSANLDFLQRPYESSPHPALKKKTSFGSLFLRRKASVSAASLRDSFEQEDALGIKLARSRTTETLLGSSNDEEPDKLPQLEKQMSQGSNEEDMRPWTTASRRSDAEPSPKPNTKVKLSFASMFVKNSMQRELELEPEFIETADHHFTLANHDSTLRKARSYSSFMSRASSERTLTPVSTSGRSTPRKTLLKSPLKSPRKSPRLFKKRSTEGIVTSADIPEPFPYALQKQQLTPRMIRDLEENRAMEYSRDWFLAEARAEMYDYNPPTGGPIKEPTNMEKWNPYAPFETPRATPKPPTRPERWDPHSIFADRRMPLKKEKDKSKKYERVDVKRFNKY